MALAAAPPALWHNHSDPFSQKQFPCALDPKAVAIRMFELHCGAPEIGPPWFGTVTKAGVKLGELSGFESAKAGLALSSRHTSH